MRLKRSFFNRPTLVVAKELLGKYLVRKIGGEKYSLLITEVEGYVGESDLASHARFGKTKRNEVMYEQGGLWYMFLIYGMYWMLNVTAESINRPGAVLIRGGILNNGEKLNGPGKITRRLKIDKSFNFKSAVSGDLYLEDRGFIVSARKIKKTPRIGIDYAAEYKDKPWRFVLEE
jgi:DNA-3-methyladenine glycosylase